MLPNESQGEAMRLPMSHVAVAHRDDLHVRQGVLRREGDVHGEEGVWVGGGADDKLHGAAAVGVIDEVHRPQQRLLP